MFVAGSGPIAAIFFIAFYSLLVVVVGAAVLRLGLAPLVRVLTKLADQRALDHDRV